MKYINIIFRSTFHTPTASGWNVIPTASTGTFALNYSDGSSSPFSITVSFAATTNFNNSAYAGGDKHGIPQDVIKATGSYVSSTARTMSITRSDATAVDTVKVWGASNQNDANRQARWTIEGTTVDHDDRNYGAAAPSSFTATGATWPIDLSVVKVPAASFGYPNVIQLEVPDTTYSVTAANSGNPIKAGATFPATTTGFINVTAGTIGGKALTGVSFSANTVTATAPTLVDGGTLYEPDTAQDLIFTDGTNSNPAFSVTAASPDGMSSVELTNPVLGNDKYIPYWMASLGYTPVSGDRIIYVTADCTVGAVGDVTAPNPVTTEVWLWQASGGTLRSFDMTIDESGVTNSGGLTSEVITSSGLTSSGLTSSGL